MKRYTPKQLKWTKRGKEVVAKVGDHEYRLRKIGKRWFGWWWFRQNLLGHYVESACERCTLRQAKQCCQQHLEATVADLCDEVCDGE